MDPEIYFHGRGRFTMPTNMKKIMYVSWVIQIDH